MEKQTWEYKISDFHDDAGIYSNGFKIFRPVCANTGDIRTAAAAPELLELVRLAYDRLTDNDMIPANAQLASWLEKARAAIAKAEGR